MKPSIPDFVAGASPDMDRRCQACGSSDLEAFYEASGVPTQTCVLLDTEREAGAFPLRELTLVLCARCGFIQNATFDPSLVDYSEPTEESQAFSGTFRAFADALADELVTTYDLVGGSVLEVGCGKGEFLALLVDKGVRTGIGIDPGYLPERLEGSDALEFSREWYGPDHTHLTGDLVMSRHLMEHVPNVAEFLGWLRSSALGSDGGGVFTEVPDTTRVLDEGAFWDVYYEHCSYFTEASLRSALEVAGCTVEWLRLGYEDQYLLCGATVQPPGSIGFAPEAVRDRALAFGRRAEEKADRWREEIEREQGAGRSVAIWGGGSKAVAFLAKLGVSDVTVVDINPYKQGKWLPGIGVEVRPPSVLLDVDPSLVIVMNPIYRDEISTDLDAMGLTPRLEVVD